MAQDLHLLILITQRMLIVCELGRQAAFPQLLLLLLPRGSFQASRAGPHLPTGMTPPLRYPPMSPQTLLNDEMVSSMIGDVFV